MEKNALGKQILSWTLQIIAVAILAPVAISKFTGDEMSSVIFTALGLGEAGKFLIGTIELGACVLMLTKIFPHYGAFLALATMCGAALAHLTVLGLEVQEDGGLLVSLLFGEALTCLGILYLHRHRLPLVGNALD